MDVDTVADISSQHVWVACRSTDACCGCDVRACGCQPAMPAMHMEPLQCYMEPWVLPVAACSQSAAEQWHAHTRHQVMERVQCSMLVERALMSCIMRRIQVHYCCTAAQCQ